MQNKNQYFGDLKLYQHFFQKATPEQIALINKHIDIQMPLLDFFYKAFPTYTLHNLKHQQNIIRIMGDLLGDKLTEVSTLEAALLLLSAVYHDLGMVFSETELENIEREDEFTIFLNQNFKAKLQYKDNDSKLNKDLAEWYCRWAHAKRVWIFLKEIKWGIFDIKKCLGSICESHNYPANKLIDDKEFETDFIKEADLRFVSVLLRISDILDFDNSRSPQSVYEFLELDSPKNINEEISKNEWNKHLCSDGFSISNLNNTISLDFKAAPNHPQIETNIQNFLTVIEDELKNCSLVIEKCSERWRTIRLPLTINRDHIKSQNYKRGNYRLSLDENQIIKLLAGENLYSTEFVFIRELLQNAIDTSRMREYYELGKSHLIYKAKPIEIKSWVDNNGYRWVRVDDYGMGINEYVLENHLLKKGSSYYNSDFFKIQKKVIKEKTRKDFTPISRFGIGLLSCFILGDTVEINTKAIAIKETNSNESKLRLSIKGLQGQYYVQSEENKHIPQEMPNSMGIEKGYRKEFGTSIAVRVSRKNDFLGFEKSLEAMINHYILCSPVQILYEDKKVGTDFNETLNTPLAERRFIPFSDEVITEIEEVIGYSIKDEIGIEVLPIDVTKSSKNHNLKGQLVFLRPKGNIFEKTESQRGFEYNFSTTIKNDRCLKIQRSYTDSATHKTINKEYKFKLDDLFDNTFNLEHFNNIFLKEISNDEYYHSQLLIVHNGINVPNYHDTYSRHRDVKLAFKENIFTEEHFPWRLKNNHACFGIIYLQDNLIPDLSISRDIIKGLSFSIYSSLFLALKELNNELVNTHLFYDFLEVINEDFNLRDVISDDLIELGFWDFEKIIYSEKGTLSINELKEEVRRNTEIKIESINGHSFIGALTRGLLEISFNVEYNIDDPKNPYFTVESLKNYVRTKMDTLDYYPLLFVSFSNTKILSHNGFINLTHKLGTWIYSNKNFLSNEFEIYFKSLVRCIIEKKVDEITSIISYFRTVLSENIKPDVKLISKSDFHF